MGESSQGTNLQFLRSNKSATSDFKLHTKLCLKSPGNSEPKNSENLQEHTFSTSDTITQYRV